MFLFVIFGCNKKSISQDNSNNQQNNSSLQEAYKYYTEGDSQKAKLLFEKEIANNRNLAEASLGIARIAVDEEDVANAKKYISAFFATKSGKPDWTIAWGYLTAAKAEYLAGDNKKAFEYLNKAKEIGKPKGAMEDLSVWELRMNGYENVKQVLSLKFETDHLIFYANPSSQASNKIDYIKSGFEKAYAQITKKLSINPKGKITLFLYDTSEQGKKLTLRELGFAQGFEKRCHLEFGPKREQTFGHEITHVISYEWGIPSSALFGEGLAVYLDQTGRNEYEWCKDNKDKLLHTKELAYSFFKHSSEITYPQSAAFVRFIDETYGTEILKKLYQSRNLEKSWKELTGKDLEDLNKDFFNKISKSEPGSKTDEHKTSPFSISDFNYPDCVLKKQGNTLTGESDDEPSKIIKWYAKEMPSRGWKTGEISSDSATFSKNNQSIFVLVIQPIKGEKTTITITLQKD